MRDFNRGGFGGGRSSFGNKRSFDNRGPRPTLYKAVCSKCGKECELPFKPTGERPVFCRDCFRENGGESRRVDERNLSKPTHFENRSTENPGYKEQFIALNAKLDKILSLLNSVSPVKETPKGVMQPEEVIVEKKKRSPKKT